MVVIRVGARIVGIIDGCVTHEDFPLLPGCAV